MYIYINIYIYIAVAIRIMQNCIRWLWSFYYFPSYHKRQIETSKCTQCLVALIQVELDGFPTFECGSYLQMANLKG